MKDLRALDIISVNSSTNPKLKPKYLSENLKES